MIRRFVIALVRFYQHHLSVALHAIAGPMAGCRYTPSCSAYFIEAVNIHGTLKGSLLGIWRIMRCNPWGGCGHDPVPKPRQSSQS